LGFTQEEHAEVNDRNDMYFEARWLAFPHAYAEAERTKAAAHPAHAKRRKTRRTTTR
jgi:hypothetical protein